MVGDLLEASRVLSKEEREILPGTPVKQFWDSLCSSSHMSRLANKYGMDVGTVRRLTATYADGFESYMAAPMTSMSMNWFWDEHEKDQHGGDRVVVNGYYHLIDYLATGVQVYTNTTVTKIETITPPAPSLSPSVTATTSSSSSSSSNDVASSSRTRPTVMITTDRGNYLLLLMSLELFIDLMSACGQINRCG
jgi:hypothetical protein